MDQFGNYFIQKTLEYLNPDQIKEILNQKIPTHFRCLCFNQYGTRVIQKIFEKIVDNEECLDFYSTLLISNLNDFIKDQHANHIIIKYINLAPNNKINFIIDFIKDNILDLSTKKHSCFVIQKCIEYSDSIQKKEILKAIAEKSYELMNDQYGNYVIQYCINVCDYEINKIIAGNFLKNLQYFSMQKYSSNVIEKCLDCCDEDTKEKIIFQYCNPSLIRELLFNIYGNYIIQKVVFLSKEPIRSQYIQNIGPLMDYLLSYPHGQKLYNKLLSSFKELSRYINRGVGIGNKCKNRKSKNINYDFNNNINNHNLNYYQFFLKQINNNNINSNNNLANDNLIYQNYNNQFDYKNMNMNIMNTGTNYNFQNNNILLDKNLLNNNNIFYNYMNNNPFNLNNYAVDNIINNKINMIIN